MATKTQSVGAFEAKNRFSELIAQVGTGAEITITKHDKPVAKLVAAKDVGANPARLAAATSLRALQQNYSLKGLNAKSLISAGRR